MDVRQQDVERIVVEVLKKMMSDQPTAAATTVVAASGCDCGDFGLFDRLEDAVQAAEAAQKKISVTRSSPPSARPALKTPRRSLKSPTTKPAWAA